MKKADLEHMESSVAQALDLIGDWWTIMIIRDGLLGITRFDEFHNHLGIARNVLSTRMKRLVEAGIMEKKLYIDRPARYDYLLTNKGAELLSVILALRQWGDRWIFPNGGAPFRVTHALCGGSPQVSARCELCGEEINSMEGFDLEVQARENDREAEFWARRKGQLSKG